MAFDKKYLDDYVEVHVRIEKFKEKHEEGSLQSEVYLFQDAEMTPDGKLVKWGMVVMKGIANRWPGDISPGIGFSSMTIPGANNFTKGSEIENAETSAWGRALAALGFEVKRSIASANEIANKRTEPPLPAPASPKPTVAPRTTGPMPPRPDYVSELQFKNLMDTAERKMGQGNGTFKVAMWCKELDCTEKTTTREQWKTMMEWIVNGEPEIREPGDEPLAQEVEDLEEGFKASMDIDGALSAVGDGINRVDKQTSNPDNISVKQANRLYYLANKDNALLKKVRESFGFASDRDIPWRRYDEFCKALEAEVREAGASA